MLSTVLILSVSFGYVLPAATPCLQKADIYFVVDQSTAIGTASSQTVTNFIADIIDDLPIGRDAVRVGLIGFNSAPRLYFNLLQHTTKSDVKNAISNMQYTTGNTSTDLALAMVRTQGFTAVNGDRRDVNNIAFLITEKPSTNHQATAAEAARNKAAGIYTLAVGIKFADGAEMRTISNPYYYPVTDFDDLPATVPRIRVDTCEVATRGMSTRISPNTTATTHTHAMSTQSCKKADIVFVLDASGSISQSKWDESIRFVKSVITDFDIGVDYTEVAVIKFNDDARVVFPLNQYTTKSTLMAAVDAIKKSSGGTYASKALELLNKQGFANDRPGAPNIAIVVTDGKYRYPILAAYRAEDLKNNNIRVFAVGVGDAVDTTELEAIATDPSDHVFTTRNTTALKNIDKYVVKVACTGVTDSSTQTTASTVHTGNITTAPLTNDSCFDVHHDCPGYGRDVCSDFYPWARANCRLTCGFCNGTIVQPTVCEDQIDNCDSYGSDVCYSQDYYSWAEKNCKRYCGLCGTGTPRPWSTSGVTTPVPATTQSRELCADLVDCPARGSVDYVCKQYPGFAHQNCKDYCGICPPPALVQSNQTIAGYVCPEWILPPECVLEQYGNECCPIPSCPDSYVYTVEYPGQVM
ncbi:hypothetical protein ScPMuIL_017299 [Solemya velum]